MKKNTHIGLRIFFTFIIILIALMPYYKLFYLSYLSVKVDCYGMDSIKNTIVPVALGGTYSSSNDKITIYNTSSSTFCDCSCQSSIKHEEVHQLQAKEGRLFNCNNKIGLFINELEAYIKSDICEN